MASIADFLGLTEINKQLAVINKKLDQIMATQSEAAAKLAEAADKLEKAKGELLAEIEKLKAGGELSPEAQAAVERIQALAQALDDIVPDAEPAPEA